MKGDLILGWAYLGANDLALSIHNGIDDYSNIYVNRFGAKIDCFVSFLNNRIVLTTIEDVVKLIRGVD